MRNDCLWVTISDKIILILSRYLLHCYICSIDTESLTVTMNLICHRQPDIDFLFKWLDGRSGFVSCLDNSINQAVGEDEEHEAS